MVQNKQLNMEYQNPYYFNREYMDIIFRFVFREKKNLLELEDAFPEIEGREPSLKCTAILLNINYGHNREMMKR